MFALGLLKRTAARHDAAPRAPRVGSSSTQCAAAFITAARPPVADILSAYTVLHFYLFTWAWLLKVKITVPFKSLIILMKREIYLLLGQTQLLRILNS